MSSPWNRIWRAATTRPARRPSRTPARGRRRGFPASPEVLEGRALLAAAGYLDTTFGPAGTGLATVTTPGANHNSLDVEAGLVLPDGSSYAATSFQSGNSSLGVTLLKVNANGTPDTSFGQGTGAADVTVTPGTQLQVNAIVTQTDGKVVVTGEALPSGASAFQTFLARFNTDGTPDTTFGTTGNGVVLDGLSSGASQVETALGAVVLGNGEILTTGLDRSSSGGNSLLLRLHRADGTLDPAFGNSGTVLTPGASADAYPVAALQGSNIIVSARQTQGGNRQFLLYRFKPDGSLDTTFGTNGVATGPAGLGPNGPVVVLAGGVIFQAGTLAPQGLGSRGVVARYTPNGQLDTTFGTNGVARTGVLGPSSGVGPAITLAPGGKILVGGVTNTTGSAPLDYGVTRLNPDGSPDSTFGNGGTALVANPVGNPQPGGSGFQAVNAIGVLANGNVLITGRGLNANGTALSGDVELARFAGTPGPGAGTITGRVYADYNVNHQSDPTETSLAGHTVYLDFNSNGVPDVGDPSTVTDASGNYTLNVAAPGTYTVRVAAYPGDMVTGPANGAYAVTTAAGQTVPYRDFGLQPTSTLLPTFPNAAPFGANNPDAETAEVIGLYRLVLGRDPEDAGRIYQVNQLKSGVPLARVAYGFYHSPEYFKDVIVEQYQNYLGRPADGGEVDFNQKALTAGETVEQLAISLLSGPEQFKNVSKNDNGSFVQALYQDVLGRPASDDEVVYYTGLLNGGASRGAVASSLVHSPEADVRVINSVYSAFFARAPFNDEKQFYLNELQNGTRLVINVAPGFLGSPEYNQDAARTVTH